MSYAGFKFVQDIQKKQSFINYNIVKKNLECKKMELGQIFKQQTALG